MQNGCGPLLAEAVGSFAAGLQRLGLPMGYAHKKLSLKMNAPLQKKEAEIVAAEKLSEKVLVFYIVAADSEKLARAKEAMAKEGTLWSAWELGVPLTQELCVYWYDQQTQFLQHLNEKKSPFKRTLQLCK